MIACVADEPHPSALFSSPGHQVRATQRVKKATAAHALHAASGCRQDTTTQVTNRWRPVRRPVHDFQRQFVRNRL